MRRLHKVACAAAVLLVSYTTGMSACGAESAGSQWRLVRPEPEGARDEASLALDESWAEYEQAVTRARDQFIKSCDPVIAAARRKGDPRVVEALAAETKAFDEQGTLPTDKAFALAVATLKKKVASANTTLLRDYTKAVASLTKKGDTARVNVLQAEQDSVFARADVVGGPRKAVAKPWVVNLSNEAIVKREWTLDGKWNLQSATLGQNVVGQMCLGAGASMTTIATFDGDLAMELAFEKNTLNRTGDLRITCWGQELVFRDDGAYRLQIRREGEKIIYSLNGQPPEVAMIKAEDQAKPSTIKITCNGFGGAAPTMSSIVGPIVIQGQIVEGRKKPEAP